MTRIKTLWEIRTYDVIGNAKDGYEVNDVYPHGKVELYIPVYRWNVGTSAEFKSAHPSDKKIRSVFGVSCRIDTDGDDITIYVNRRRDGYPIGEMYCVSHSSLSPIRK